MAYTTINNPELYAQTKIFSGNGGTNALTLDGSENMQPDWVWLKLRDGATAGGKIYDSVRGVQEVLSSNENDAESTTSTGLTAFGTNGFTLGSYTDVNRSSSNIVSWNWKMGTSFSNDASATSVGTIDSTGSINTTAGQSIISYSGTGSAGTVAHGLGAVPKMIIVKSRSNAKDWTVYHSALGNTQWIELNDDNSAQSSSNRWNNTSPTSSVFTVATDSSVNASGYTYIAYCFSEISGFSKVGSYKGNGSSTDGSYIHLGFKPSFFLVKGFSGTNAQFTGWFLYDNKRSPFNKTNKILRADTSDVEGTSAAINFLSQGIKMKQGSDAMNDTNITYLYYAVAESPFVNENGVPNNAR